MGLFDILKKKDTIKQESENISEEKNINIEDNIEKVEIKKKHYEYKGKNYLTTDDIENEIKVFEEQVSEIPSELKKFWIEQGYGFIGQNEDNFQRLLNPTEIIDFINKTGDHHWIPDDKFYDSIKEKGFVIMEYSEYIYFWIGTQTDNLGKIFYFDNVISNSFNELINKLENNIDVIK